MLNGSCSKYYGTVIAKSVFNNEFFNTLTAAVTNEAFGLNMRK